MLSPGDMVKDYEVVAPLRSGGMAMLYLARRRGVGGFSRLVALKLVHSHLVEDESINRLFLNEARISANVAHPNVVNVEEVGQSGGNYFIAMEYVHGVSLAELLGSLVQRRLRMSPKLCVWVAAQVAEALHAVHGATGENGAPLHIVHRDVSPQNVLISETGHVKLIDFGIANSQLSSLHTLHGRAVLGKLGYMAPEQLRVEPVDRRSDFYALGVMLWEMLTSRNLFRCKRIDDERDWATREAPPAPSKYSNIALPALDRVVLKALALKPAERHQSALEFRAALLRAAPAAAQVDAPMFGGLLSSLLGEELERRRADWPSDIGDDLHQSGEVTTGSALSLGELTADMGAADDSRRLPYAEEEQEEAEDGEDPTTIAEAPAALRGVRSGPPSESAPPGILARGSARVHTPEPAAQCALATPYTSPAALIDTVPMPASDARPPGLLWRALHGSKARALALSALCLGLGLLSGLVTSRLEPAPAHSAQAARARPAAVAVANRQPSFTVLSELTLRPSADAGDRPAQPAQSAQPRALAAEPPPRMLGRRDAPLATRRVGAAGRKQALRGARPLKGATRRSKGLPRPRAGEAPAPW